MYNATFNNISVISWRLVLFEEETEGSRENQHQIGGSIRALQRFCIAHVILKFLEI